MVMTNDVMIQEEYLCNYCSLIKEQNKLTIKYNYWKYDRWGIIMLNIIIIPVGLFFLILIYQASGIAMFWGLGSFLSIYPLIFLTIGLPLSTFLCAFKNKTELIIDKESGTLVNNKVSKRFKQLNSVEILDVNEVVYKAGMCEFFIRIILKKYKKVDFFYGSKDLCKIIGIIIADFLETPFSFEM